MILTKEQIIDKMQNMNENGKKIIFATILLIFYFILQIYHLDSITKIWVDEPWYSNTAFNVSLGKGFANTLVGSGGGDEAFLYTMMLGSFFKMVKITLFSARLFSVFLGGITLILIFFILRKRTSAYLVLIGMFAIVSNSSLYVIFRTARPEAAGIMFMTTTLYFLLKDRNILNTTLASLFGYCSFLSHPAYLSVPLGILIILIIDFLRERKIKPILAFIMLTIIIILLFIVFIVFVKHQTIAFFFADWFSRTQTISGNIINEIITKFKNFAKDYSLGIKRFYIMVFELLFPLISFILFRKERIIKELSIFALFFIMFTFVALSKISLRFFTSVSIPVILIAIISCSSPRLKGKIKQRVLSVMLILYIINSAAGIPFLIKKEWRTIPYSEIDKKLADVSLSASSCATLINFWFPFKEMVSYNEYTRWENTKFSGLEEMFDKEPADMIVISDYMLCGESTTSGREITQPKKERFRNYYETLLKETNLNYIFFDSIKTMGYGTIKIYKKRI